MENLQSGEGSSSKDASGESSESTLQLNIKTLDSRIFSFQVDKNIAVSEFKEKIAIEIGIPVGQQRLIFRGKVLKDDHVLSAYNVENGDTLHVVERQPQPPPGSNSGEATSRHDSAAGGPRNHIGHIAHSVVLGTLNVGDAGEAGVPDLSRVIGAVLNSVGLSNLAGGVQPGIPTSQANETGGSQVNAGSQSQSGDQQVPSQGIRGQSAFYPMQTPTGATIAIPSLNAPIPDSLNTLTGFMNQMESVLSQNGGQQDQPPTASSNPPSTELPRNSRGYPTVEALTIVLQQAQQLLRDHVVQALSHTASRLEEERESNDPSVRGQIHTESMRLGIAMQHLGALLLELGRTILTLRLGLTPNESFVNAGPAVYISPLGPNPIMVQPFPLQTSPLFGGLSGVAMNPMPMGTLGIGSVPRNINIHINTRGSLPLPTMGDRVNNGEDTREGRANGADSGDSGQDRVSSGVNVTASAVPSRPAIIPTSGEDAIVAEINSLLRGTVSRQNANHAPSEGLVAQQRNLSSGSVGETSQNLPHVTISNNQKGDLNNKSSTSENSETLNELARSNRSNDDSEGSSGGPLGLGLGGLQPKRRGKQPRGQDKKDESIAVGQHVLQSLASLPTRGNANPPSSTARQNANPPSSTARQNADGPVDVMGAMSHVLGSPSLDGLLAGVSQQTGVGSPDMLRNMLQQFTQNPAMMNTVNQIAQQVDSHDLGSMFSGLDNTGQGGGFDLSRMMQQMMPIVSQALGGGSSISQLNRPSESMRLETSSRRDITPMNDDPQIDLRPVVQRLEDQSPSEDIFESLAVRAMNLSSNGNEDEDERVLDELCSQDGLAQEFMDMLRLDISRRIQDETGS